VQHGEIFSTAMSQSFPMLVTLIGTSFRKARNLFFSVDRTPF
jgi:hypothetical protein